MNESNNKLLLGRGVHTLAQSKTSKIVKTSTKPMIIVNGKGSDISNNELVFARNKRKLITQKLALCLIDVAAKKGHKDCLKEYWNTYYCLNELISDGNRVYGNYCKNRICTVCSGNRKAELINKYLPVINKWETPYFVTLTIKSVSATKLNAMMKAVMRGFRLIINKYKKRNLRGNDIKLQGIKSLECNFNPKDKIYNPHFHIIVPNELTADILIKEWLYYCNRKKGTFWASKKAQHKVKIFDNEICLVEVIKYGSKIITKPKNNEEIPAKIYVNALHNILRAMKGLRIFERFGFNLPKQHNEENMQCIKDYDILRYNADCNDWIDIHDGIILSNYSLPNELKQLLNNNIDLVLE
ncbi:MAG: protein rep [Chitinophagales bacterium]|nr:protein rep [Chitinophagales bacterium]